jgi:hypothetical protein
MEQTLGFSLDEYSYAEAQQMFVEKGRAAWQHTAFIVSYLIEINRDKKKGKKVTPNQLNPWEASKPAKPGTKLTPDNFELLKALASNV